MNSRALVGLQEWYKRQCDGDWEHSYGIHIDTLDNPGWRVDIHLKYTALEDRVFQPIKHERTDNDWVHAKVGEFMFRGRGGPGNLEEIIELFLQWSALE